MKLDLQVFSHLHQALGTEFMLNFSSMAALCSAVNAHSLPPHRLQAVHTLPFIREGGRRRYNAFPPFHHLSRCSLRKGNVASGLNKAPTLRATRRRQTTLIYTPSLWCAHCFRSNARSNLGKLQQHFPNYFPIHPARSKEWKWTWNLAQTLNLFDTRSNNSGALRPR